MDQHPSRRFQAFTEESLAKELDDNINKNTKAVDKKALSAFKKCLQDNDAPEELVEEFWKMTHDQLDHYFACFFAGARKQNGEFYKLNSMVQMRHALIRILRDNTKSAHIDSKSFHTANRAWKLMEERLKAKGLAVTKGAKEITDEGQFNAVICVHIYWSSYFSSYDCIKILV